MTIHNSAVKSILYMHNTKQLITGGDDNVIFIINYTEHVHPIRLTGHKGSVSTLVNVNSPSCIVSAGWDG